MPKNPYKILIRESHLDTFGHINNATYLEIFEEARWDLLTRNGFGLKEIQHSGQGPVILEITIKFLKEIRLREEITVTTELLDYVGKIGHLRQQMQMSDGTVACEVLMTFGLFDLNQRKLLEPTTQWMRAIQG